MKYSLMSMFFESIEDLLVGMVLLSFFRFFVFVFFRNINVKINLWKE